MIGEIVAMEVVLNESSMTELLEIAGTDEMEVDRDDFTVGMSRYGVSVSFSGQTNLSADEVDGMYREYLGNLYLGDADAPGLCSMQKEQSLTDYEVRLTYRMQDAALKLGPTTEQNNRLLDLARQARREETSDPDTAHPALDEIVRILEVAVNGG